MGEECIKKCEKSADVLYGCALCTTRQACVQSSNLNVDHLEGSKRLSLIRLLRMY